jgi:hypothetical protein
MSLVAISGNASGTGTLTIAAPNTNSNYTLNLPAATGTVMVSGNMPAFSAYQSTLQSTTSGVASKIQFQTEEFDTASCFDSTTNYRFTPNVAGYYQISGAVVYAGSTAAIVPYVYKNGSSYKRGTNPPTSGGSAMSALVYLNGSTDYVEFYAVSFATQNTSVGIDNTYFQGILVRAA